VKQQTCCELASTSWWCWRRGEGVRVTSTVSQVRQLVTSLSSHRPDRSAFTRRVTDEQYNCSVLNTCCS